MTVHEIERMVFTAEHLSNAEENKKQILLHIDEKNFKAFEFGKGKVYIIEGKMSAEKIKQLTTLKCQSTRNISWVMFQACVGEPRPELGFDGKLYIRRICTEHKAQKDSVHHEKGDRYDKHTNYNSEMHLQLMKELCAAITVQFKGVIPDDEIVYVQMDGAGPHSVPEVVKKVERMGRRNIPPVVFFYTDCTVMHSEPFRSCIVQCMRRASSTPRFQNRR
jgi:CRISPR/Cas system-associated exonuclease Cas4 (RecB family)